MSGLDQTLPYITYLKKKCIICYFKIIYKKLINNT